MTLRCCFSQGTWDNKKTSGRELERARQGGERRTPEQLARKGSGMTAGRNGGGIASILRALIREKGEEAGRLSAHHGDRQRTAKAE